MTIDDKTYADLVELARQRCRGSAMSVSQLLEERDQLIALLINIAIDMAAGAISYMKVDTDLDDDMAAYLAINGITYGLGEDRVLAGKKKCAAHRRGLARQKSGRN